MQIFRNDTMMVSRALDDTMKLWDIRNTSQPLYMWDDLANMSPKTGVAVSPNEKVVITGTSVRKGFGEGQIVGFNTMTGEK